MAKHQSHADRSIALMERGNRAAKVELTPKKALAPLYTVSEVAEYLQVSPSTVYRMIQDGRLSGVRVGHGRRRSSPGTLRARARAMRFRQWKAIPRARRQRFGLSSWDCCET